MLGDVRDDNSYQNDHSNLNNNLTNQLKEFNIINQNISRNIKIFNETKDFYVENPTNCTNYGDKKPKGLRPINRNP